MLAAIEVAAGRKASHVVGKPEPVMYAAARDRLDVDVAGARRAGIDQALVLTGATSREEAEGAQPRPTLVADSLGALVLGD